MLFVIFFLAAALWSVSALALPTWEPTEGVVSPASAAPGLPLPAATGPVHLSPGQRWTSAVEPGDQLRVFGKDLEWGLLLDRDPTSSSIAWRRLLASGEVPGTIRIPTASDAKFLAIRTSAAQVLRAERAVAQEDSLDDYRLDLAVYAWLGADARPQPNARGTELTTMLSSLATLRSLLDRECQQSGAPPRACPRLIQSWLQARWLGERLTNRRLSAPFFRRTEPSVSGASALAADSDQQWELSAEGDAVIRATDSDLVTVTAQLPAKTGGAMVFLFGDHPVREFTQRPETGAEDRAFADARSFRFPVHGESPLRVHVTAGVARVQVRSYATQTGFLEPTPAFSVPDLLQAAQRAAADLGPTSFAKWIRAAIDFEMRPRAAALKATTALLPSLSASQRALALTVSLPSLLVHAEPQRARELVTIWLQATEVLPSTQKNLLRLQTLRDCVNLPLTALDPPPGLQALVPGESLEAVWLRVLSEIVFPPTDGADPYSSAQAEGLAAHSGDRETLRQLARLSWLRASPLIVEQATTDRRPEWVMLPVAPTPESPDCQVTTDRGSAYTVLSPGSSSFDVDAGIEHVKVRLKTEADTPHSVLVVDGEPVHLRPDLDRDTVLWLRGGRHTFDNQGSSPIYARLPRQGSASCTSLRTPSRWYRLIELLEFRLQSSTPSFIEVTVLPASVPPPGARLSILLGAEHIEADVTTGSLPRFEFAIGAGSTPLQLRSETPLVVRVAKRRHRSAIPTPPPHDQRGSSAVASRNGDARQHTDPFTQLRLESEQLRLATTDEARATARQRRATLLSELGYQSYADAELMRSGLPAQVESPGRRQLLPATSPPVLIDSLLATIPRLEPSQHPDARKAVLDVWRRNGEDSALDELLAEPLSVGSAARTDEDTLLLALLAERAERPALAAAAWSGVATTTGLTALTERIARLQTDHAAATGDRADAETAHLALRRAQNLGLDVSSSLARFGDALRWVDASTAGQGRARVVLEQHGVDPEQLSFGERVRRALTEAPDTSFWLSQSRRVPLTAYRGSRARVLSRCFRPTGTNEACEIQLRVDDEVLDCEGTAPRASASTQPLSCEFDVAADARALKLSTPQDAQGWYVLTVSDSAGKPRPISRARSYVELTPNAPFESFVSGPTVVRVESRQEVGAASTLRAVASPSAGPQAERELQSWTLPSDPDPVASIRETRSPVTRPHYSYLVLSDSGPQRVRLKATGRAFVRVWLARLESSPAPRMSAKPPPAPAAAPLPDAAPPNFGWTPTAEPASHPPLSLNLEASYVNRDVLDVESAPRDAYLQLQATARSEVLESHLWVYGLVAHRLRADADSQSAALGTALWLSRSLPSALGFLRVTNQQLSGNAVQGYRGLFLLSQTAPLGSKWDVRARTALLLRHADRSAAAERLVDQDVYTSYAFDNPTSYELDASVRHRPYLNTALRFGIASRFLPALKGVDRAGVNVDVQMAEGPAWFPRVDLLVGASHRPRTAFRDQAFTRLHASPSAEFWSWTRPGERWSLGVRATGFVDLESLRDVAFYGTAFLSYDFLTFDLRHFNRNERLFRQRLEEGAKQPPGQLQNAQPDSSAEVAPP